MGTEVPYPSDDEPSRVEETINYVKRRHEARCSQIPLCIMDYMEIALYLFGIDDWAHIIYRFDSESHQNLTVKMLEDLMQKYGIDYKTFVNDLDLLKTYKEYRSSLG